MCGPARITIPITDGTPPSKAPEMQRRLGYHRRVPLEASRRFSRIGGVAVVGVVAVKARVMQRLE
jgi:hypothetical protein